ncbi:MAG: hypothetical protein AB1705_09900 [Verrucomicrobiota bacterium]
MNESVYFGVASVLLYSCWYAGLGWFVQDSAQRQGSRHFWTRPTLMLDLDRDTVEENSRPLRQIEYPKLVGVLVISFFLFLFLQNFPKYPELRTAALMLVALLTPIATVCATYGKFVLRWIPLVWGALIGCSAVIGFVQRANPWGMNPREMLNSLLPNDSTALAVVLAPLIALVAFATANMRETGKTKPTDWFAWCIFTMALGSGLVAIGLISFDVI